MIIDEPATGARPVPSSSVKFRRTFVSACNEAASSSASAPFSAALDILLPSIFDNPLRSRRIEHSAGTKTHDPRSSLLPRPAAFFDEIDHLLRQRVTDHAVPAHGGKHHHLAIGQLFGLAFESQRIA